jgi:glyoxylase-like metal-dependent hydrolase (beta-lactamase superfamily II)
MKAVQSCRRSSGWLALCLLLFANKSVLAKDVKDTHDKVEVRKTTENTKTPAQDLLDQLVATIGDVYSFTRVQMESTGSTWVPFEAVRPGLRIAASTYQQTVSLDLRTSSQRTEVTKTLLFYGFAKSPAIKNRVVIAGTVGGGTAQLGTVAPGTYPSQTVAALKRQQELFNPHILLRKALKQPKMLSLMFGSTGGGLPILRYNDGHFMIRIFSDENGFITQLSVLESNPLTRDTAVFVKFYDWTIDASGVLFPRRVQMAGPNQIVLWEEVRTSVKVDPILPQGYFKLLSGTDANSYNEKDYLFGLQAHHQCTTLYETGFHYTYAATYKAPQAVIPGVYWLQSNANSLLIPHEDGWILVEAAGSEVQARNLLSTAFDFIGDNGGKFYSGKTDDYKDDYKSDITHLIQSHHHVDHAAGVRQVLAETGATLVVGFGIRDFYEKRVLLAPSTVRPDGFTGKTTVSNIVRGVATKHGSIRLINTMELTVEVYHTSRDPHANDSVLTVVDNIVAGELVMYVADLYNAGIGIGSVLPTGPASLFDAMRDIGLIDSRCESSYPLTIVPAHGVPTTLEDAIAELDKLGLDVGC